MPCSELCLCMEEAILMKEQGFASLCQDCPLMTGDVMTSGVMTKDQQNG